MEFRFSYVNVLLPLQYIYIFFNVVCAPFLYDTPPQAGCHCDVTFLITVHIRVVLRLQNGLFILNSHTQNRCRYMQVSSEIPQYWLWVGDNYPVPRVTSKAIFIFGDISSLNEYIQVMFVGDYLKIVIIIIGGLPFNWVGKS